jgi:hypothetical protein
MLSLSLTVLFLASNAQVTKLHLAHPTKAYAFSKINKRPSHQSKKVNSAASNTLLDYSYSDQLAHAKYSGIYAELLNMHFVNKDTGKSPNQNFDLSHSATVAFDTILDANTDSSFIPKFGSLTVDTIGAIISYRNTSNKNDTLKVLINNVTAAGYPGTAVLSTTTLIMRKGVQGISGKTTDSLYYIYVAPKFKIASGYKFAVTMQFYGAKTDTFELAYSFPKDSCAAQSAIYCDSVTAIGPKMGKIAGCNSYTTGFGLYQASPYTAVMWPNSDGEIYGNGFATDEYYNCGTDTEYFYNQDYNLYASVSYTDSVISSPTSVNNLSNKGLTVAQNYPNPFNRTTQIPYSITKSSDIEFTVYDITGRKLINNSFTEVSPGQHIISLSANEFTPGIYFYTFNVNGNAVTKKMIITE